MLLNNIKTVIPQLTVFTNAAIPGLKSIDNGSFPSADQSQFRSMFSVVRSLADGGSGNSCIIRVGTGDTAPAATDYCLANDVTSTLTYVSGSANQTGSITNATVTYRNDTASAIIIKEVGLSVHTGYTTQDYQHALMTREVLATPVTIGPGESKSFNTSIRVSVA